MKINMITIHTVILVICLVAVQTAWAQNYPEENPDVWIQTSDTLFTAEELDDLLGPIALYPDPLIAQILPASTFIDQIDEAARYVRQYGGSARIDVQPWDVSVKAVAHYPDVLFMMDGKYEWTVSLGQAYVNQPQDLMDAIQRLRATAAAEGNLVSNPYQQVIFEDGVIRIVPSEPQLIYVPRYDPMVVYVERPAPSYGFITFGIGFTIGAWLNRDCDWHGRRVFYHGWRGGGWIGRSRSHMQVRNNFYVNNTYDVININRRVIKHDTARYREVIRRDLQIRRERSVRPAPPAMREQTRPPAGVQKQQERTGRSAPPTRGQQPGQVPVILQPPVRPDNTDVYRGRDIKKVQPGSSSGYGGYGSGKDAAKYRERGQDSREKMRQDNRTAPFQGRAIPGGGQHAPKPALQPPQRPAPPAKRIEGGQRQQPVTERGNRPAISGGSQPAPRPTIPSPPPQAPPGGRIGR